MKNDWDTLKNIARECKNWDDFFSRIGIKDHASNRRYYRKHGIDLGNPMHVDWDLRREIARTCTSWNEYFDKAGITYSEDTHIKYNRHNIRLLCWFCRKNLHDTAAYYKSSLHVACNECVSVKHLKVRNATPKFSAEAIACSLSHNYDRIAKKCLLYADKIDEYTQAGEDIPPELDMEIVKFTGTELGRIWIWLQDRPELHCSARALRFFAKKLIKMSTDADNPFYDPAFIAKVLNMNES